MNKNIVRVGFCREQTRPSRFNSSVFANLRRISLKPLFVLPRASQEAAEGREIESGREGGRNPNPSPPGTPSSAFDLL